MKNLWGSKRNDRRQLLIRPRLEHIEDIEE